ncbi:MAG TPA: antibiotic biosynthesis monooxygenase [Burkholderiaceae bacterium]|nr:antibiotic biosynthesis monooxygenase [Burkholderiaceae bacterium]HNB46510.1 antibiotic biosynthesis monooxygenase [Burkholderiaceae bacterium]HNG82667.1 antibiotic biosynthesis monooxygenase [Burkholderiaceae bacterium]
MTMPQPTAPGAVTVLITRRIKPGHEAAFEAAMTQMIAAAAAFPGHLGGHLVRPGEDASGDDGGEGNLYHVIFAYDSPEHLAAWQASPVRALGLTAVAPHTEGEQQVRQLTGMAHWFVEPKGPKLTPPPRWKVAVVTWLGIFPTVLFLFLTVVPLMADWPLVPRTMVVTALVVLIMTWGVAPRLTQWLKPWLHPATGRPAG